MRKTPKKLAETPKQLELRDPRGDFLADVLGASLIRHALYSPIDARAPWSFRVSRGSRASFYLVASGSARLEVEGEKVHVLAPGEIGFVPHVLRDSAASTAVSICDGAYSPHEVPWRIGGRGAITSIIGGFFSLSQDQGVDFLEKAGSPLSRTRASTKR